MNPDKPSFVAFEAAVRSDLCIAICVERFQNGLDMRYICDALKRDPDGKWSTLYQISFHLDSEMIHQITQLLAALELENLYEEFEENAIEIRPGVVRKWYKRIVPARLLQ